MSNLKFKGTTNYANCTNHLAISIRVISAIRSCSIFVVLIIKFNVQTSNSKGTTNYANCTNHLAISIRVIRAIRSCSIFVVLIIKFKVQTSMFKGHFLYLWWSLTFMLGEDAAAVSIEEFFEGFNL